MRSWMVAVGLLGEIAAAQVFRPSQAALDAQAAVKRRDYMAARVLLSGATAGAEGQENFFAVSMWQQITPMLTNELTPAEFARGRTVSAPDAEITDRVRAANARPALAEIVARARQTNVVILNEAHYSPRDRAFALEVARALRPLGYSYLAAETFNQGDTPGTSPAITRLVAERAVTNATGFYTHDPVFAGYVNAALRLGYTPVAYESTSTQNARGVGIQPREDGEAENLQAFLLAHPGAKLLIHVGHGHVNEVPRSNGDGSKKYMMAARLKQLTGIDPLTIDQTIMSDLQSAMRKAYPLAAAKAGPRDAILFEGDRPLLLGSDPGTDLQVVHPARRYAHGRPTWLAALGGRPVSIPTTLLPRSGERLIQAFAADAPADAVPLDQVLVAADKPAASLMLPRGVKVRYATQP